MMFDSAVTQPQPTPGAPQPPARPSREEMRQSIEDAIRAAREAALAAQTEAGTAQPPPTPFPPFIDRGPPEGVIFLIVVLASLAAATIVFAPLFRAFGRRLERRNEPPAELPPDMAPRLDRIEQAIEAIAVEVERISEGQRYVTKSMHELRALPAPNPLAQPMMAQREAEAVRRGDSGA